MSSSADSAELTVQMLRRRAPEDSDQITVAAQPIPVTSDSDGDELSAAARRAGWLDILGRSDDLAATCVSQAMMQNGGEDFPYSNPERITPGSTPASTEWVARLQPAPTPRPAAFQILTSQDEQGQALIDPETDAPGWHADDENTIDAAIPQRIPAQAPLAEVILDDPIWIRTSDGKIWPAPKDSYYGLSWGYHGSGPGTLALLIGRLLDDINTAAADDVRGEEELEAVPGPPPPPRHHPGQDRPRTRPGRPRHPPAPTACSHQRTRRSRRRRG